eukprot:15485631-Alexandrium_andersonii.AAC.1
MIFRKCNIASGVRNVNCAGPGKTSKLASDASGWCVLRCFSWRFRWRQRNWPASAPEALLGG